VEIFFGIKALDKADVKWWDPNGIGKPVWDTKFDITDPVTQKALLDFSYELKDLEASESFIVRDSLKSWILEF
jgi:hypothetical protein